MRAKSFFYASLGILALALAYHLGATTATAQAPTGNPVVAGSVLANATPVAITANGDSYYWNNGHWSWLSNVFAGGPTPAAQPTFGQVKAQYRK